ncbi:MAG: type III secretion system chaperone [Gammaproteobacteria bacterium]|nr:type III secretion system chaperone [Gammaproteobacteria bacterium]MXY55900.1 type III secretion system chaperone [Gammaproteobacteria bacterium]MYF30159.1 type III secretion system chaperone [Gammaproteobacteria bacterium]MYK44682.1 type III secretion system chaperone [Gammaproteobacteria bacterium]
MSLATMTSLLAEFGAVVGIPDLKPDAELRCNMMFDDVAVSFQLGPDDESLYVYSLVGTVAEADTAVAYPALLRANYALEGTAGSTFSLDPRSGGIVLIRAERLETLRLGRLEALVEDFVNAVERWAEQIRRGQYETTGTARGGDEPETPAPGIVRV